MTKAWDADIDLDRAAIAFGCNRETMKKHYIRKEALAILENRNRQSRRVQASRVGDRRDSPKIEGDLRGFPPLPKKKDSRLSP